MSRVKENYERYLEAKSKAKKIKDRTERKAAIAEAKRIYKIDEPVTIHGEYFGSHKAISEHIKSLALVAHRDGIDMYRGGTFSLYKELLTTIPWSSVIEFDFSENTDTSESSRVTLTRAAALGVLSLGAQKKKVQSEMMLVSTLKTKTGDIVLEYESKIDNTRSTTGTMANAADRAVVKDNKNFKISVINHTGQQDGVKSKEIII